MGEQDAGLACVVANVAGEGGLDIRRGLRHFAAGARAWVLPPQWGDRGTDVLVVGYHRGTRGRGLVRMVVPRRHLTGFRVQAVYGPAVARELARPLTELGREHPPRSWPTREEAEAAARNWRDYPLDAWLDSLWSCPAAPGAVARRADVLPRPLQRAPRALLQRAPATRAAGGTLRSCRRLAEESWRMPARSRILGADGQA
jgi:hypothetical protein